MRKEHQLATDTDLQQVGAGFLQQWSGSQQLRVVGGYFQRDSQGVKNSGSFWQVENLRTYNIPGCLHMGAINDFVHSASKNRAYGPY